VSGRGRAATSGRLSVRGIRQGERRRWREAVVMTCVISDTSCTSVSVLVTR
jgi:hypothetical protein